MNKKDFHVVSGISEKVTLTDACSSGNKSLAVDTICWIIYNAIIMVYQESWYDQICAACDSHLAVSFIVGIGGLTLPIIWFWSGYSALHAAEAYYMNGKQCGDSLFRLRKLCGPVYFFVPLVIAYQGWIGSTYIKRTVEFVFLALFLLLQMLCLLFYIRLPKQLYAGEKIYIKNSKPAKNASHVKSSSYVETPKPNSERNLWVGKYSLDVLPEDVMDSSGECWHAMFRFGNRVEYWNIKGDEKLIVHAVDGIDTHPEVGVYVTDVGKLFRM